MLFNKKIFYNNIFIAIISVFLLVGYWYFFFSIYQNEDLTLKIINQTNDSLYLPLIFSISNFDFSQSFNINIINDNIYSFPILSLAIYSFFYKIFGVSSILLIQLLSIFLFLKIFFEIFLILNLSKKNAYLFSLATFLIPFLTKDLTVLNVEIFELINNNIYSLYDLRYPRPLTSNLFLFASIYFIIKIYKNSNFSYFNFISLSLIIGFTLHTFFYFFVFQIILIALTHLFVFKKKIFSVLFNQKKYFFVLLFNISLFVLLFILQNYFSEPDHALRIGVVDSYHMNEKLILLKYLFNFFTNKIFVFIFLTNLTLFIFYKIEYNIFFFLFISTIVSTIIFFSLSNKMIDPYHMINWILISGSLNLIFNLFYFLNRKVNLENSIFILSIILLIIYFNISFNKRYFELNEVNSKRQDLIELTNYIKETNMLDNKSLEILTFDKNLFSWLVMNNFTNFTLSPVSFWVTKKNITIEKELISVFKFFNLNSDDYVNFFSNKKSGYRYKNSNTEDFFDRTYLANSMVTFENSKDFTETILDEIKITSPMITHQLLIPNFEFERMKLIYYENNEIIQPKYLILHKGHFFYNKILTNENYCDIFKNNNYLVLSYKDLSNCRIN
jgi:hypothetical protein